MQLRLALHNCADVLKLHPQVSAMITDLFMQSEVACCLTVCDIAAGIDAAEVTAVAASPRFGYYFKLFSMPQPLRSLLNASSIQKIVSALQLTGLRAYRQSNLSLAQGTLATVSALPLNRLSALEDTSSIRLSVMVFEDAAGSNIGDAHAQHFWYSAGGEFLRATCDVWHRIASPVLLLVPPEIRDPPAWSVLFEEEDCSKTAAPVASCPAARRRPVLAVPRHDVDPRRRGRSTGPDEEGHTVLRAESREAQRILTAAVDGRCDFHKAPPPSVIQALASVPSP